MQARSPARALEPRTRLSSSSRPSPFWTTDGSETWSDFTQVSGLPQGASLNLGTELSPGLWQVATADLRAGLVTIRPAENSDADFTLTLKATITDTGNGTSVSREITGTHQVSVAAVADAPVVGGGSREQGLRITPLR